MAEQRAVAAAAVAAADAGSAAGDVGGFPFTVKLKRPIRVDGEQVSELMLHEPTLAALEDVHLTLSPTGGTNINLGDIPKVVASMARIPPSSAREISLLDLAEMVPLVMGFLGLSLETGES